MIVDDCEKTAAFLNESYSQSGNLIWKMVPRDPGERSGPWRLGKLRNLAVEITATDWLSFLDDDNEFEPNHIRSLIECGKRTGCRAVHSQRKLYTREGDPYLEPVWPWCREIEDGRRAYKFLVDEGVFEPGSNVERDRCDPPDSPKADPIRIVDTSEWLLARSLLQEFRFCTEYSYDDWRTINCLDDKFLKSLIDERVEIGCTEQATLKYYLGGFSNDFLRNDSYELWGN